jgi:multidrug efflux pump subunit AcrB
MAPYNAVKEVMGEIGGAIIAITLMMVSVFIPIAFMTGPVGVFYRQFSITMAGSIIISAVVALTLTPVLCAMMLKPHDAGMWGSRISWIASSHGSTRASSALPVAMSRSSTGWWLGVH